MIQRITIFFLACFFSLCVTAMAQGVSPTPTAQPFLAKQNAIPKPLQQDEEIAQHSKDSEFTSQTEQLKTDKPIKHKHGKKATKAHKEETPKSTDTIEHQ